ncbi:MAG TPA: bifunctional 2-polyprenyl-6-hydroxyphenol methylase/3-demethylubiquinol 3-O-methyltransferase UbiG [Dongiaceae bacterium]|nr:bifunctional 2-polyprenyl-6-hydroxyphenol methylase/3-demethylubiquinol 3-O-methyltransferase UbiG [Dongiaceae bacterium]
MSNVDAQEIAKFEAVADKWWDRDGEFKPLHEINPLRLNYINERTPLAGKKILDVGCGGGILSEGLAFRGADVTGIDMGQAPLDVARAHAQSQNLTIDYRQIPVEQLAAEMPAAFDIITCMEMLEHVPDPASVVKACAALVKPGGHVFFSTLNRNPKAYLLAIVGAEYVLNLVPRGTHDYLKFIKPSELASWARDADLAVKDISGLTMHPLTRQFKVGRDADVNYFMHTQRTS